MRTAHLSLRIPLAFSKDSTKTNMSTVLTVCEFVFLFSITCSVEPGAALYICTSSQYLFGSQCRQTIQNSKTISFKTQRKRMDKIVFSFMPTLRGEYQQRRENVAKISSGTVVQVFIDGLQKICVR